MSDTTNNDRPPASVMAITLAEKIKGAVGAVDDLVSLAERYECSVPDMLREVLEEVARNHGGSEGLVATRPGSWEADHFRILTMGADFL